MKNKREKLLSIFRRLIVFLLLLIIVLLLNNINKQIVIVCLICTLALSVLYYTSKGLKRPRREIFITESE